MTFGNLIAILIVLGAGYGIYRAYRAGILHLPTRD